MSDSPRSLAIRSPMSAIFISKLDYASDEWCLVVAADDNGDSSIGYLTHLRALVFNMESINRDKPKRRPVLDFDRIAIFVESESSSMANENSSKLRVVSLITFSVVPAVCASIELCTAWLFKSALRRTARVCYPDAPRFAGAPFEEWTSRAKV